MPGLDSRPLDALSGGAPKAPGTEPVSTDLDPRDWDAFRAQAHRMLDDILDFTRDVRARPVWTPTPAALREGFREPLPRQPRDLAEVHARFLTDILPFSAGNTHPGFMGWVQGGGTPVGTVAEMLAAGLNANLGGRDQMPIEVERQVLHWMRELFDFPPTASGLFVTGTSMANLMAVLVARTARLGTSVRERGLAAMEGRLVAYTSVAAHGCIAQALDLAGFGKAALRCVPVNARFQIDLAALAEAIAADRCAGLTPFLVVGTAGTVDVGAVDDLAALADIARREALWLHVDGAYGALGRLAPAVAPCLDGIERADSIAFDFHKWGQVPYDAGFLLVRDGRMHHDTFAAPAAYLRRESRGLAAGSPWPCDFGPDLSRGFRALKTWFTFQVHGSAAIGAAIAANCALARHLAARIDAEPALERLAPVALNIVCFRHRGPAPDTLNAEIVVALQEGGRCAPSATTVDGRFAIRAAVVNHRTVQADVDRLVDETLRIGAALLGAQAAGTLPSTADVLLQGGDDRTAVDPATGRNRYGCTPAPEPSLAAFGSSTATSISPLGFAAAERLHRWLESHGTGAERAPHARRAAVRIADALKESCGVADLPGLEVVLAASGTDLHRIAADRVRAADAPAVQVVMMASAETGSGVAVALAGLRAPVEIALRRADGRLRPLAEVHADVDATVARAIAAGNRVLLVTLDVSKTGLLAPAPDFVQTLRRRHAGRLAVLVDACQFRLSAANVRRYVERGFMVALTGSKFVTGPSFSGALLVPAGLGGAMLSDAADVDAGLLLRWTAALAELDALRRLPADAVCRFVDAFAAAIVERLEGDPAFERLEAYPLDRGGRSDAGDWDARPTLFPFLVHRPAGDGTWTPLHRDETVALHRWLPDPQAAFPCQFGQPVACGTRGATPVSALRLGLSARLIVEALAGAGPQAVIDRALAALDRVAGLAASTPSLEHSDELHHA